MTSVCARINRIRHANYNLRRSQSQSMPRIAFMAPHPRDSPRRCGALRLRRRLRAGQRAARSRQLRGQLLGARLRRRRARERRA